MIIRTLRPSTTWTERLESPRVGRPLPVVLSQNDVERLLDSPNPDHPLYWRDRAVLELLYATGMRVSELAELSLTALDPEEDVCLVFGKGSKIRGVIEGLPAGGMKFIQLRRPGGLGPEDVNPLDMEQGMAQAKFLAGMAMVQGTAYEIEDVEPGTYILEIPRIPDNPMDLGAYAKMADRSPWYRTEITVESRDIEHDIKIEVKE